MSRPSVTNVDGTTALAIAASGPSASMMAVAAREEATMRAALVVAANRPRNVELAKNEIMTACQDPGLAEKGTYLFPRGTTEISGPSATLAREIARAYGNIHYGMRWVESTDEEVHLAAFATDLESGATTVMEDRFKKLVQRKDRQSGKTMWVQPDERDLRELVNRRSAILERNCILKLIPYTTVQAATLACLETRRAAFGSAKPEERKRMANKMVSAFQDVGVSLEQIAAWAGLDKSRLIVALSAEQFADLRAIYASIREGNSRPDEYFDASPATPQPSRTGKINMNAARSGQPSPDEPRGGAAMPRQPQPSAPVPPQEPAEPEPRDTMPSDGLPPPAEESPAGSAPQTQSPAPAQEPLQPEPGMFEPSLQEQVVVVWRDIRQAHFDDPDVKAAEWQANNYARKVYGKSVAELTDEQAKAIIDKLAKGAIGRAFFTAKGGV